MEIILCQRNEKKNKLINGCFWISPCKMQGIEG